MKPRLFLVPPLVATILAVTAAAASGQSAGQRARWLDLTFGVGRPLNGRYLSAAGPAVDANFAFDLGSAPRSKPTVTIAAAAQGGLPVGDNCVPDSRGGCLENLPSIRSVGMLLGWEYLDRGVPRSRWSVDISAGPGVSFVNGDDYGEHVTVLSLHSRGDVAFSIAKGSAVVASVRAALLPSAPLSMRSTAGIGLGFRVRL